MKTNLKNAIFAFAISAAFLVTSYQATADENYQQNHAQHHKSNKKLKKSLAKNPAVNAYIRANRVMHSDMNICYSGDADIDFVAGMIPHHQGAVDMAKVQLQFGKDEELKKLTRRIIIWQEAEIGQMKQWLSSRRSDWKAADVALLESVKEYQQAMEIMHRDMDISYTGDVDYDFVKGMIPHHQGAIDMAWTLKKYSRDAKLRELANDIIRSQGQEIRWMKEWLERNPQSEIKKCQHKNKKHNKKK